MTRRCGQLSEAILLAMACLSPWAFGAVRAWAEAGLYLGVALIALLSAVGGRGSVRLRGLASVPGLALAGLALLALAQASAWPGWLAARVVPASGAFRASLAPAGPQPVEGDPGPPVAAPGPALSQCPELSLDAAARLAAGWVLFQSVVGMRCGPGALRRLGLALAANAALLALFALVQRLCGNGRMYWVTDLQASVGGGPFSDKNHLASYLNLGLGFALALGLSSGRRGWEPESRGLRLAALYVAGLTAVGVLASLSRGGFVAMLAATAVLVVTARTGLVRVVGGLAMVLALVAAFLFSAGVGVPSQRLATLLQSDPYLNRLVGWKAAARGWSVSPVLGLGLGTFTYTARFFEADDGAFFAHAENDYLEMLAEGGVVGLALALLMLAAVTRLGLSALAAAPGPRERVPILGAFFGVVALAVHCLGDFPLHIPAIAVVAVMLAAHLTRAGLDARGGPGGEAAPAETGGARGAVAAFVPVVVSLLALGHGVRMARSEAEVLADGLLAPPGYEMPTTTLLDAPMPRLGREQARLEAALRHRPDWAEGQVRLGLVLLSEYRVIVAGQLAGRVTGPVGVGAMADPLWLHRVVHTARPEQIAAAGGVLAQDPVRRYLVPAARAFLEARRCCPVWGLPHAELAALDYLLPGGGPTSAHARRALRVAGPESPTLALAAQASAQAGDLRLAAACWRRMVEVGEGNWPRVAADVPTALKPDQLLAWVIPDGRSALWFADTLYAAPADRQVRDSFLEFALMRLPGDRGLTRAERLALEAQALARLGRAEAARLGMTAALGIEPRHAAWRKDLVVWLIAAGRLDEAHEQAVVGLYYAPADPDARRAAELAAEALARGGPGSGSLAPR